MKLNGIYGYWDCFNQTMVYIGQSNDILKRNRDHYSNDRYDEQVINRVLQNNLSRYKLVIIKCGDYSLFEKNILESHFIWFYNTFNDSNKFNYTKGGDNHSFTMSKDAKQKISKSMRGVHKTNTTKRNMSEAKIGNQNKKDVIVSFNTMVNFIEIRKYKKEGRYIYVYCKNGLSSCILKRSISYKNIIEWAENNNMPLTLL